MDRRQFLRGAVATGALVVGASAITTSAHAAPARQAATSGSAEAFLLGTARRALA